MFGAGSYTETVQENAATQTPVTRVAASDGDSGVNGEIAYSISDNSIPFYIRVRVFTFTVTAKLYQ